MLVRLVDSQTQSVSLGTGSKKKKKRKKRGVRLSEKLGKAVLRNIASDVDRMSNINSKRLACSQKTCKS
jgi:hypothetical protein